MSNRVQKSQDKSLQRSALAAYIALHGVEAMPCTRCFKAKRACLFAAKSSRCNHCVASGKSCSGSSVATSLLKNLDAQKKIREEREKAEEELASLLGRLSRLRSQERSLSERGAELFARGVQSEEGSLVSRQQDVGSGQALGLDLIDWDAVLSSSDLPSDGFDFSFSQIVGEVPDNSSGEILVPTYFLFRRILPT